MTLLIYNLLFPLAFVLYSPFFLYKLIRRGNFKDHFGERFGLFSGAQKARLAGLDRPVWIHAVSVGEVVAAVGFIRRWQQSCPDRRFVLSTTTTTGHATAKAKLPENVPLVYCPLDFYPIVRRTLELIKPSMLVIFEVEIWPNLLTLATGSGVPAALVNGRMSDRSARGYARHRWLFADLFAKFDAICVQSAVDAERVAAVVGERVPVHTCDTMKFDQVPDREAGDKDRVLERVFGSGERVVFTAGSTHGGEEELVADVFRKLKAEFPALKLVLVPRHQERTGEVELVLRDRRLDYVLATQLASGGDVPQADVLLVNTTGELMQYYAASDLVFVGKSLAGNSGGHNIIEPAIFGKAIVHGSQMQNFRHVASVFQRNAGAVEVSADEDFLPALRGLLADSEKRVELGKRARAIVERYRGAMDRTVAVLEAMGS